MADGNEIKLCLPKSGAANILKLNVKKGMPISSGTLICTYQMIGSNEKLRFKCTNERTFIVHEICVKEKVEIEDGHCILKARPCQHSVVMKEMCADCGADLRGRCASADVVQTKASVAMVHSIPELVVSEEQALELGAEDEKRLLENRKLVLLVDLDETVLHSTNDNIPPNLKDVYHFQLLHGPMLLWYHTKIRPHMHEFLETISKLYELHICTFGARLYAHTMARFLDPAGKYFSKRILSRQECFDPLSKTANLKALFPCGDNMVCIIDDREEVWNWAPNMIRVKPYIFFDGTADINAPPSVDKSRDDNTSAILEHRRRRYVITRDYFPVKKEQIKDNKGTLEKDGNAGNKLTEDKHDKENKAIEEEEMNDTEHTQEIDVGRSASTAESDSSAGVQTEGNNKQKSTKAGQKQNESKKPTDDKKGDESEYDLKYTEVVEWEDNDDYLLYLIDTLKKIHRVFYDRYQKKIDEKGSPINVTSDDLPNLKDVVPDIKRKVLEGVNIVFSGVVPTSQKVENSVAYHVARSLGANIQNDIMLRSKVKDKSDGTTHVVAAKMGTHKIRSASRNKDIKVVSIDWLWTCNHRWEKVPESLFPLDEESLANVSRTNMTTIAPDKRKAENDEENSPPGKRSKSEFSEDEEASGNEDPVESASSTRRFSESINPLYMLSQEDLNCMGQEVDDLLESSNSENPDDTFQPAATDDDGEAQAMDDQEQKLRQQVLGQISSDSSSTEDSMSGDYPRGWPKHYRSPPGEKYDDNTHLLEIDDPGESYSGLLKASVESAHWVFDETTNSSVTCAEEDSEDFNESGEDDDDMVEALERELFKN